MRKLFLPLFFILFFATGTLGQKSSVKGVLIDSSENKNLNRTVISVMRASDSVLLKFTRADQLGNFSIQGLDPGHLLIMITHPYFGDRFEQFNLLQVQEKDFGKINMIPKSKLLAEVIVKSGSPIKIKGDTTIYTADSFQVRPGANVEELLRRLPGIQVDKDGQITAMGERVRKVLVDGEEFFGTDPGIATKNLRADYVEEVQVFDKKSDQAAFTGIDDGVKDKTINLKLKDSKKNGYFGKVEAAGGLKDKYTTTAMMNAFKAKRKIAGYGIMSNTGRTTLDWQDGQNYGADGSTSGVTEDGGMYISISYDEGESFSGGRNGIPVNKNAGFHFSNKYLNDKLSINGGYKLTNVDAAGLTSTFSKTFLPDTSWFTNSRNNTYSSLLRQALNFTLDANIDSFNSIKWTTRANSSDGSNRSTYYTETLSEAGDSINNVFRNTNGENDNKGVNSSLLWRRKFRKPARTLSINTDFTWNRTQNDSRLYSLNRFFSKGIYSYSDTLDQNNLTNSEAQGITTRIAYTEPLAKDVYMEVNYSFSYNNNLNNRITSEDDGSGKYLEKIDSLSNNFSFKRIVNTPGASIRINKKKINYTLGGSVGFNRFIQDNISDTIKTNYNFVNFFPRANIVYKLKANKSLRFNYNGSTTAPSLDQLQPIRNNTDRLNNYIGNQDLKQSFRNSIDMGYSSYNPLTQKNIYANGSLSLTQNAFTQSSTIDSAGRRTYQTVNANGVHNYRLSVGYSLKIPETNWRVGLTPNTNFSQNVDFVIDAVKNQQVKNMTKVRSFGSSLSVEYYVQNKYRFYLSPNFSWNNSKASVNSAADAKYWQLTGWASASITLPYNLELATEMNYQARQKDKRFPQNSNFSIWDASIVKRMFKNELEVKFGVNDILNQNKGYQRNFNSYSFTESYFQTLKRFWLLTVTWNFSKNGKPVSF